MASLPCQSDTGFPSKSGSSYSCLTTILPDFPKDPFLFSVFGQKALRDSRCIFQTVCVCLMLAQGLRRALEPQWQCMAGL